MNDDRVALAKIRPTSESDLPQLRAIVDGTQLFPSAMLNEMIAPFLAATTTERWLTSDVAGVAVALAYYVPERMTTGTWNLLLIAVRPDRQGAGIGTALMRYVESDLASTGERLLLVETSGSPEFAATRAFYRSIAYEEEARIREFYQAGEDKVVFRKALVGSSGA